MEIDANVVINLLRQQLSEAQYNTTLAQAKNLMLEEKIQELEQEAVTPVTDAEDD